MKTYNNYEIIEDNGSGINFNREGLRKIIKLGIEGKINKLVVAYKDRLTKFGLDLTEDLLKEPKEELVDDVLQILNVYTAKKNRFRKYKNK